eukprot:2241536-Rhodomonas_salina.2
MVLPERGSEQVDPMPIVLRLCYAMSGTDIACLVCYAMFGTDIAVFKCATRCPVLPLCMQCAAVLRQCIPVQNTVLRKGTLCTRSGGCGTELGMLVPDAEHVRARKEAKRGPRARRTRQV